MIATVGSAQAAVEPTAAVIINEVYGAGGNTGATIQNDFVELYNTTDDPVSLDGWSVQYSAKAGTSWSGKTALTGSIPAKSYYLVAQAAGTGGSVALPSPDATGSITMGGTSGNVALVETTDGLTCAATACAAVATVVDLVGYGTEAMAFAGSGPTPDTGGNANSLERTDHVNTADNAADFTASPGTPTNSAGETIPDEPAPGEAGERTIAEIQGTGSASPIVGDMVTTEGVVTAAYPTGGFNGYVIQTPGTGGTLAADHDASDAIFVYSSSTVGAVTIGDYVQVTGLVGEHFNLTQITVTAESDLVKLTDAASPVTPVETVWPASDVEREALESMLVTITGDMTVTDTYSTHQYGEVGLASGTTPLVQPTDVVRPGPGVALIEAENAARGVRLDDGASTNFLGTGNTYQTPPYVSLTEPVRVGAKATLEAPVIVDYRNDAWKLNPIKQVLPGAETVSFGDTRTAAPDAAALGDGDLHIASFNVLNYFTTLGKDVAGCTAYDDRAGNGITTRSCPGNGPRGAWDAASLKRQQDKIVAAINATDADVTGLMEIENSVVLGKSVDSALGTLVAALNADAGSDKWAFVPASAQLPAPALMDVITNAIIYQPASVTPTGASLALGDQSGSGQAFVNAREPIGQVFTPADGGAPFLAVVNHFKSKGSAGPVDGDADSGDGQASSNGSRKLQATALANWVDGVQTSAGVGAVALLGDFNSYTMEDPLQILYDAGYVNATTAFNVDKASYSFSGLSGSLDHVLLNAAFLDRATGADIWNINAPESIALEYSRFNAVGTLFYENNAYRSSDHDPVIVGFEAGASDTTKINLLNINDFHGRIDANTVKFAGTVEQLRAEYGEGNSLFLANGDNVGASLFASASQQDNPTIDVLNALDLKASGVGNHEFDKGIDDLLGHLTDRADWSYVGANVYLRGTKRPILPEYKTLEVNGLNVAVIGAVTEETRALVSPGGIAGLDFGDPVEAVNRVAAKLTDGDPSNGEADVIIAEYHEGAGQGTPDGATLEEEIAHGGAFAEIVEETSAAVDVIFTGHTHKEYSWDAPIPGSDKTRPVLQTGSYGANIGQIVLTVDNSTKEVTNYSAHNVKRIATADEDLIAAYPRVAEVNTIVQAALEAADVIGSVEIGSITADITTAFAAGSRDDRSSESTLGNLVANSLRDSLSSPDTGGAQIGVVNPGGLRADLIFAKSGAETEDGRVTYAEANAVLPFVNNLWTTTLTGAQFKTLLEQQWQTNPDGTIPSRPYLQLGLSDNVSYTYDATRDMGDRITSVSIDGEFLDPTADYRMGTFSFLAQGGDNFRVFADGSDTKDTGLIDRDAWIEYLTNHQDLSPNFARHAVGVAGAPSSVATGASLNFEVSGLDLTSLGSPATTTITGAFTGGGLPAAGVSIGSANVTDGAATITGTVPAAAAGATTLTLVAAPSGTTVLIPMAVDVKPVIPVATKTTLTVSGDLVAGKSVVLRGSVSPANAAGKIEFRNGSTLLGSVNVGSGADGVFMPSLKAGTYKMTATFVPHDSAAFAGSVSAVKTVTIKAAPVKSSVKMGLKFSKTKVAYGSPATVKVTITGKTAAPKGKIQIREGKKVIATGTLKVKGKTGTVTIKMPKLKVGTHKLTVKYAGSTTTKPYTSKAKTFKVTKAKPIMKASVSKTGRTVKVTVSAKGVTPTGKVTLRVNGKTPRTASLKKGKVTFKLPKQRRGTHTYKITYNGSTTVSSMSVIKKVRIR